MNIFRKTWLRLRLAHFERVHRHDVAREVAARLRECGEAVRVRGERAR